METAQDLPELLYIYDPLCGWCYGMTPVVQRVRDEFSGRVNVSVLSGGMVTGDQVGPIRNKWEYIKTALADVEQVTGAHFGDAFRALGEEGSYVQDSEPPCRALSVFRQLDARQNQAIDFAHDIQHAYFGEGKSLNDLATYDALVKAYNMEAREFRRQFAAPVAATATQQEFAAVARIGVTGYPTIILRVENQGYLLARGFQRYDELASRLEQALEQAREEAST